jgi:hypothetical protein
LGYPLQPELSARYPTARVTEYLVDGPREGVRVLVDAVLDLYPAPLSTTATGGAVAGGATCGAADGAA